MTERFGKIQSVKFGFGGYQDICFGLSVDLGSEGWGVSDFIGEQILKETDERTNKKEFEDCLISQLRKISSLLIDAKVTNIADLKNKPIAAVFDGNLLKSWRVLTEVI